MSREKREEELARKRATEVKTDGQKRVEAFQKEQAERIKAAQEGQRQRLHKETELPRGHRDGSE